MQHRYQTDMIIKAKLRFLKVLKTVFFNILVYIYVFLLLNLVVVATKKPPDKSLWGGELALLFSYQSYMSDGRYNSCI